MTNDALIVAKFGGTSLTDSEAVSRCAGIVSANRRIRVVVVSAPAGITNQLLALAAPGLSQKARQSGLIAIVSRVRQMAKALNIETNIEELLQQLQTQVSSHKTIKVSRQELDAWLAFGERFSVCLMKGALEQQGVSVSSVDAATVIKTDSQHGRAQPVLSLIEHMAHQEIAPKLTRSVVLLEGFIGSDPQGVITTLGRGGSDYSAALLAEALDAEEVQIWTDVPGIHCADPHIVAEAQPISRCTFEEAAELAHFGARVLHPASLRPAMRKGIRVYVGSSMLPDEPGTMIEAKINKQFPLVRAVTHRSEQVLMEVQLAGQVDKESLLAHLFATLSAAEIHVDLVATSETTISMTLSQSINAFGQSRLTAAVMRQLSSSFAIEIRYTHQLSAVAMIGNYLQRLTTMPAWERIMQGLPVMRVFQGASHHHFAMLVPQSAAHQVVTTLHELIFVDQLLTEGDECSESH